MLVSRKVCKNCKNEQYQLRFYSEFKIYFAQIRPSLAAVKDSDGPDSKKVMLPKLSDKNFTSIMNTTLAFSASLKNLLKACQRI